MKCETEYGCERISKKCPDGQEGCIVFHFLVRHTNACREGAVARLARAVEYLPDIDMGSPLEAFGSF